MKPNPQNHSSIQHLKLLESKSLERGDKRFAGLYKIAAMWLEENPECYIMDIPDFLYPVDEPEGTHALFHSSLMKYFAF